MFSMEDILKILLALVAGGVIGMEREFRDKAAGFRTLIFICVGAALFTILSVRLAGDKDPTRIAANIVSGVGFLGAGVILREGGHIIGLTTASIIWLTSAVGMSMGGGQYLLGGIVTGLTLIVSGLFPRLERHVDHLWEAQLYEIVSRNGIQALEELEQTFKSFGLRARRLRLHKSDDMLTSTWQTSGTPQHHKLLLEKLFADENIHDIKFYK